MSDIFIYNSAFSQGEKKGYNYSKFLLNILVNCPNFFARIYSHMTYP